MSPPQHTGVTPPPPLEQGTPTSSPPTRKWASVSNSMCILALCFKFEKYIFRKRILKGVLDMTVDFRCFWLFFQFFEQSILLALSTHLMFLLNFTVFSSSLSKQYRVTNLRSEKKEKMCFHDFRNNNPSSNDEKPWAFPVFATFPTRKHTIFKKWFVHNLLG